MTMASSAPEGDEEEEDESSVLGGEGEGPEAVEEGGVDVADTGTAEENAVGVAEGDGEGELGISALPPPADVGPADEADTVDREAVEANTEVTLDMDAAEVGEDTARAEVADDTDEVTTWAALLLTTTAAGEVAEDADDARAGEEGDDTAEERRERVEVGVSITEVGDDTPRVEVGEETARADVGEEMARGEVAEEEERGTAAELDWAEVGRKEVERRRRMRRRRRVRWGREERRGEGWEVRVMVGV